MVANVLATLEWRMSELKRLIPCRDTLGFPLVSNSPIIVSQWLNNQTINVRNYLINQNGQSLRNKWSGANLHSSALSATGQWTRSEWRQMSKCKTWISLRNLTLRKQYWNIWCAQIMARREAWTDDKKLLKSHRGKRKDKWQGNFKSEITELSGFFNLTNTDRLHICIYIYSACNHSQFMSIRICTIIPTLVLRDTWKFDWKLTLVNEWVNECWYEIQNGISRQHNT